MVTFVDDQPTNVRPAPAGIAKGAEDKENLASLVNRRVQNCLSDASMWYSEARTASRYYRSDQFRRDLRGKDRNRIRLVANYIRRDVDLMVCEVLDGKPVVDTSGRTPNDYQMGQALVQVLQWTRDEEENWDRSQEDVITDCFHIGEGVLFEGWDPEADGGRGMPKSMWLDSRFVLWPQCKDPQKDDAPYIIYLEHELMSRVIDEHPELEGKISPETYETFLSPHYASFLNDTRRLSPYLSTGAGSAHHQGEERVWVRRMWFKKSHTERRYYYKDDGSPATVIDGDGKEIPVSREIFDGLTPQEQALLKILSRPVEELWEAKVVCNEVVHQRLSPFDRSRGGHGKYPFCFFSNVVLRDEPRARGEIGFMIGAQDISNEAVSMYLDQLFLANIGYLNVVNGSVSPEEMNKVENMADNPFTILKTNMGYPGPRWEGLNPTTTGLFSNAIPLVKDIMDRISGRYDVDRGQAPGNIQSGRAIRALQAKTSLLGTKTRRHIESGLRRSTVMRLYNIVQFMRGSRMLNVVDAETLKTQPILMGPTEMEIITDNKLKPGEDEDGKPIWTTQDGRRVQMLVLNAESLDRTLFEKVRLTLDTGVEQNKLDRADEARTVLQAVGPAALPWVAEQLQWTNRDQLIKAIDQDNQGKQLAQQFADIQKKTGMSQDEIWQTLMEAIQGQQAQQAQQPGPEEGGQPPPGPAEKMPPPGLMAAAKGQ